MCRPGRDEATWTSPSQHGPHKGVCLERCCGLHPTLTPSTSYSLQNTRRSWPAQNKEYAAIENDNPYGWRVLDALPEDLGSIPNTHMAAHNFCNFSSRGSDTLTETYIQVKHQCT